MNCKVDRMPGCRAYTVRCLKAAGIALVVAHLAPASAMADSQPPSQAWTLEYGFVGAKSPLCHALFDEAQRSARLGIAQCEVPIPEGAGIGRPGWSVIDPVENLAVLKKMLAWQVALGNLVPDSKQLYERLRKNETGEQQVSEEIWRQDSRNLLDLAANHDLVVERAEVRLVASLPPFQVYRMTYLQPEYEDHQIKSWSVDPCNVEESRKWSLYYGLRPGLWSEYTTLNMWAIGSTDLITTKDRTFQVYVDTPAGITLLGFTSFDQQSVSAKSGICEIKIRP